MHSDNPEKVCKQLFGRPISEAVFLDSQEWISERFKRVPRRPGLAVIQIGMLDASTRYIRRKIAACHRVGIQPVLYHHAESVTADELAEQIQTLNASDEIDGILLQLPLPGALRSLESQLIELIDPEKDVDGLTATQQGRLFSQYKKALVPCTPKGIDTLLRAYKIPLVGKHVAILGRSVLVGRPLISIFLKANSTVTVLHRHSRDLQSYLCQADLVIAAIGQPEFVQGEWLKPGAVVIDVGINRSSCGKLVGDVHFASAVQRASYISPVPGGVGPMTVASLVQNTCQAYASRFDLEIPLFSLP